MADQQPLIQALLQPEAYPHATGEIKLIETHISWVILTGPYAYKIKKPLYLGFLDFSSLALRRHYCEEELRLNSRLAPELYLEVVTITRQNNNFAINGSGEIIEYAVKMKQFPQSQMLDQVIKRDELNTRHIEQFAETIAHFHQQLESCATDSPYGGQKAITEPMLENFEQIDPHIDDASLQTRLSALRRTTEQLIASNQVLISQRKAAGFIRECHGDMHLGNMLLEDNQITLFDGIEFNPNLIWIDLISEVAFLIMDLQQHGYHAWANRFLNSYLSITEDYQALPLLPMYLTYRAMVRAKVSAIRLGQAGLSTAEQQQTQQAFLDYLALAEGYSQPSQPAMIITHGLSGSGKTTYARMIAEQLGAIHLRSDVERKRLHTLQAHEKSGSGISEGIYNKDATEATYQHLSGLAKTILTAGFAVIVDATFLDKEWREHFRTLAASLTSPFIILHLEAPYATLQQHILQRTTLGTDASEADLKVLEHQLQHYQALSADEEAITIDATHTPSETLAHTIAQIKQKLTI